MSDPSTNHRSAAGRAPEVTVLTRLHYLWFAFWGLILTVPAAIAQIIGHKFSPTARNFKRWAGLWSRSILLFGGYRVRVIEDVKLDEDAPYVFISNHQNLLDILALAGYLPYPFGFVAKQELSSVPVLGLAIRNSASVFLDRSDPRMAVQSLQKAGERIRNGMSVLLFPEGTRSYGPALQPFKKGAFTLAIEAGVPIVPVVMVDGYRLMHEKRWASRPGSITIRVLEPIRIAGMTRKQMPELIRRLEETMDEPLRQHRDQIVSSPITSHK